MAIPRTDTVVRVCHLRAPDEPLELRGHTARVWHVAAGSGTQLASAAGDGTVRLWDYAQPLAPLLATYGPHDGGVGWGPLWQGVGGGLAPCGGCLCSKGFSGSQAPRKRIKKAAGKRNPADLQENHRQTPLEF